MFPVDTQILVVDDMAGVRQLVKSHLKALGYQHIYEADSGQSAYVMLESSQEIGQDVGLIITDWYMPNGDGLELLGKIVNNPKLKHIPVLMVTAEAELSQVMKAIKLGAVDYVVKPFAVEALSKKLLNIWNKISKRA